MEVPTKSLQVLNVPLERDSFLRSLIRELSGTLQDVVGNEEAAGFLSVVGQAMGDQIDGLYKDAIGVERLSRDQVRDVLEDLKRRIRGNFKVVEESESRIVFENDRCPFGDKVAGRPSLCMMTSNVFGTIAAANLGYAAVDIEEAIAEGAPRCRVIIHLAASNDHIDRARVRVYYGD